MRPRRAVPSNAQTARASAEIFLLLFPTSHYQLPTNHSIFNYFRTLCFTMGRGGRSLNVQTFQLATFQRSLSPLECAVPRFRLLTPLECAVTKTRSPKSFRMRSSEKKWGGRGSFESILLPLATHNSPLFFHGSQGSLGG